MKKIFATILCSTFLSLSLFAQQSFHVERGLTKGTNNPDLSLSLSWFASEALISGGALRLTYMNTSEEVSFNYSNRREDILQIDVTKRWHSNLDNRVTFFIELGISGMALDALYKPYDCFCLNCDCAFPSVAGPSEGIGLNYNYRNRNRQLSFFPGSTLSAGIDVRLSRRFYMGLNYRANAYYKYENKDVAHYRTIALTAGFRF